ncbi:MAG: MASE1 domain-containing protein [Isosphaeraceae bacterium]
MARRVESTRGTPNPEDRSAVRVGVLALKLVVFAVVFYALTEVTRKSMPGGLYNVLRPAAGFFLAVLLVTPIRQWPILLVVATIIDSISARAHLSLERLVLILPLVNSLTVTVNAALMRWLFRRGRNPLDLRELSFFLGITAIGSLIFASIAALIFEAFTGQLPVGGFSALERWQVWTTANLLGVLIVTPVTLGFLKRSGLYMPIRPAHSLGRWAEFTLLLAAVSSLSFIIFRDDMLINLTFMHVTYILVPFMIWIVLRFDLRAAMSTWMGVALLTAWSTQHGHGPFAKLGDSEYERMLSVQIFLCVSTLSLLAMGSVLNDRRFKEEELALSESRYRAVVEDQTELIVRALPDGTVTFVNDAVCRTLSTTRDELIGEHWPYILRGRDGREGASAERPTVTREGRADLPGGGQIWFQWTDRALLDRDGALIGYQSVGRDVSALKRARDELTHAHAQLQTLSNQLIRAQEDERRALARELHDEVGQTLTAIKIDLQRLRNRLPESSAALGLLDDTTALADQALKEVRTLSLDLRPSILDDFGLVAALKWYLDRQAERVGFTATVEASPPDLHADSAVETTCYRLVQEAVTNVIRHAEASRVEVLLTVEGERLRMVVHDDGRGFDVAEATARAARGGSVGLLGMRERASLAGGVLDVESTVGQGTRVTATFPLNTTEVAPESTETARS